MRKMQDGQPGLDLLMNQKQVRECTTRLPGEHSRQSFAGISPLVKTAAWAIFVDRPEPNLGVQN